MFKAYYKAFIGVALLLISSSAAAINISHDTGTPINADSNETMGKKVEVRTFLKKTTTCRASRITNRFCG